MALSNLRGIIHTDIRQGGTTSAVFNAFITATSSRIGEGQATLVFDNAPCHRAVRNAILHENHDVRFLPPYSPFLNTVENAWSCWKAALKAQLAEARAHILELPHQEQLAALTQLGQQNLDVITAQMSTMWYRKTTTYIHRCMNHEDILQNHA